MYLIQIMKKQLIDVSDSIADYLHNSEMKKYNPDIYLQGSFKIGTAIKPLTENGAYDIDIVCNFTKLRMEDDTQFSLKYDVGEVVKEYVDSNNMKNKPKESNRCWTLNYVDSDNFHIDILPSVLVNDVDDGLIAITDKRHKNYFKISNDWEVSNPKRFALWFKEQSKFDYYKRNYFAESVDRRFYASIEKVPDYKVKTPLQRIVQILKRHAEVMYYDEIDNKPSSVIITTLAAKQYPDACNVHNDFWSIISYIVSNLHKGIEFYNGQSCVYNPVNKNEILSGKCSDKNKLKAFQDWLVQLKTDFNIENQDIDKLNKINYLKRSLDKKIEYKIVVDLNSLFHHRRPKWTMLYIKKPRIICKYSLKGFRQKKLRSGKAIPKNASLIFEVIGDNISDYDIYWQVTNTGAEALSFNCLRGDFYDSEIKEGKKIRKESTRYVGHHYVEAFLVKGDLCYGKTEPFEVNIVSRYMLPFLNN